MSTGLPRLRLARSAHRGRMLLRGYVVLAHVLDAPYVIPTFQKISRVYNTHVMPTRTKWRTPHTINYCPYSLQLTRWTLFYLLGRACPKHPRYGPSNELCLLVHSLNLFCVFFFLSIVCTYMLMPTGSLQLLL